jgi:hypothetical protein
MTCTLQQSIQYDEDEARGLLQSSRGSTLCCKRLAQRHYCCCVWWIHAPTNQALQPSQQTPHAIPPQKRGWCHGEEESIAGCHTQPTGPHTILRHRRLQYERDSEPPLLALRRRHP